jgi:N-acetyl-gamma-glutamyl-phosphate reductase
MRVSSALLQVVLLWASTSSSSAFAPSRSIQQSRRFASSTSSSLNSKYKVFIDGEAGTTGLQVRGRIEARDDLEIISPPDELRKDEETRKALINEADVVILCT